jgi:copper(I)-binding protein
MKLKAIALIYALSCSAVYAQSVEVKDAWVRATVTGQKATGAFMKITAKDGAKLVAASSPAAGVTEVHEMKMDGGVMKMRAVEGGLDVPAGKTVELKPGGYHVMLMDLKGPVSVDSAVPMTLTFTDAKGVQSKLELKIVARTKVPATSADEHKH